MTTTGAGGPARLASGYGLLEGARWYPQHGLVFSDMTRGGVYRLQPGAAGPETLIPHRKAIGGLVADAERRTIWRFALDAPGIGASRQAFISTAEYDALPDGLAVATAAPTAGLPAPVARVVRPGLS